jgi:hypothetical protein
MKLRYLKQLAMLLAMSGAVASAFSQYVWLNEHGIKEFSDIAPPSSVPQERILKQPHGASWVAPPVAPAPPPGAASEDSSAADKTPMTTAEKNTDFNKRTLAKADKDKKAEEDAKRQASVVDTCARAASYLNSLKSGIRIATTASNGERSYLTDQDRATEEAQTQSVVDSCK